MKIVVCLIFCASCLHLHVEGAKMSDAQMKAALKLLRNVCQPKNKATNEQIDAMHKGDWNQDRNGMCYLHCVLNMYKVITKDNRFDWETGIATIEAQAPDSIRDTALHALNACKDAVKTTDDKCVAGYEIAHCLYLDNPEAYFLP